MFEVRKSIKRFRADPAWEYHRHPDDAWIPFDRHGYPFTLESGRSHVLDLLCGTAAGYPVALMHMVVPPPGANRGGTLYDFSLAVLELPFALPDTVLTPRRLAGMWRIHLRDPYSRGAGSVDPLPGSGPNPEVRRASAVPEFGMALITDELLRLTLEADCGWRLAGRHLIGWTDKRRTYEYLITMAERLAGIVAAFPPGVQEWRGRR
ncbi:hypothetical protein P3T35_000771 [Kitasatospora sp. GP30]|uniref:hypothetical protein n=1 Tax=Kitasatospora sp. GP30 TaxID=3035084 RepID=UPI000C703DB8|nr:hypothetical protein [Kitasatospora sp. GP30]MDH6138782.1 hypothetical protein [Kitasatospora sp. GP30]